MTTYATLQTDVGEWLARDDLTAYIPSFVRLGEARINRELRHWKMLKRSRADGNDTRFLALPTDFIEPKRIKLITSPETKPLNIRSPDQLDNANASGNRAWNVSFHEELEFDVAVGSTSTVEVLYYARLDALSDTNTTNWYLTNAYDLYLMSALSESAPFLKEDERITVWSSRYSLARDALNETERTRSGGGTRTITFPTTEEVP